MEGLIPFVYRAVMQYKNGNQQVPLGSWYSESPSAYYMRLPGDSGRFQATDVHLFQQDYGFSSTSTSNSTSSTTINPPSATTQIILSTGVQSPVCRLSSRRVATS